MATSASILHQILTEYKQNKNEFFIYDFQKMTEVRERKKNLLSLPCYQTETNLTF